MSEGSTLDKPKVHSMFVDVGDVDIDTFGHVNNVAYVRWLHEASLEQHTAMGLDLEAHRRLGVVLVLRRHEIDYLRQVFRGDRIEVRTWMQSSTAATFTRVTEMWNGEGAVVARVVTTLACMSFKGRPTRIPDELRALFAQPI